MPFDSKEYYKQYYKANKEKIKTIPGFFNLKLSKDIKKDY